MSYLSSAAMQLEIGLDSAGHIKLLKGIKAIGKENSGFTHISRKFGILCPLSSFHAV